MGSVISQFYYNTNIIEDANSDSEVRNTTDSIMEKPATSNNKIKNQDLYTDAIESKYLGACSRITVETVRDIEESLDLYEKIALAFLLYEQEDTALQKLLVEIENVRQNTKTNLILDWAQSRHNSTSSWQNQFVEALCVIQNYEILKRLGYNKNDLTVQFSPNYPEVSLFINVVRKALYNICECFTVLETKLFLQYLQKDFETKSIRFQSFDENCLEMYFLDCFSMKYIKQNDLSNLIRILKKIGFENKAEMLENIMVKMNTESPKLINLRDIPNVNLKNQFEFQSLEAADKIIIEARNIPSGVQFELNKTVDNLNQTKLSQSCSDNSVIGQNSIVRIHSLDECYSMDPANVGICLIINQKDFYRDSDPNLSLQMPLNGNLENRKGTEYDRNKLSETFTNFGFRIEIAENKTHTGITTCIKNTMSKFTNKDSCFIICILSHGIKDMVYGVNSVPVEISEIEDVIHQRNNKSLLGKPKVLIIQSCQGNPLQRVIPWNSGNVVDGITPSDTDSLNITESTVSVPEKSDLLVCTSTVPGYASVRSEERGSWYIQELCERINEEYTSKHFADILFSVTRNVSSLRWFKEGKYVCMVPQHKTTFRKFLYLPVKQNNIQ